MKGMNGNCRPLLLLLLVQALCRVSLLMMLFLLCAFLYLRPALSQTNKIDQELLSAVKQGNLTLVKRLLSRGANVNAKDKNGLSLLHWAADAGDIKMVDTLFTRGADVDASDNYG